MTEEVDEVWLIEDMLVIEPADRPRDGFEVDGVVVEVRETDVCVEGTRERGRVRSERAFCLGI